MSIKKIICLIISFLFLASAACSGSTEGTKKTEGTEAITYEKTEITDEYLEAIRRFTGYERYKMLFSDETYTVISGGEEDDNTYEGYSEFLITKNTTDGNPLMYGIFNAANSRFDFVLSYDYYYEDGVLYEIYYTNADKEDSEENVYSTYDMTFEDFNLQYGSFEQVCPTDEEFSRALGQISSTGAVTVSVPISDRETKNSLIGGFDEIKATYGARGDTISVSDAAITFSIKDGNVDGAAASFVLTFENDRGYVTIEETKMWQVYALGDDTEDVVFKPDRKYFENR